MFKRVKRTTGTTEAEMANVCERNASWVLPTEVLEMVLAQLPLPVLLTTHATVCQYWSDVIMNPAFIPWKKLYHRLKLAPMSLSSAFLLNPSRMDEEIKTTDIMEKLCVHHDITSLDNCLISIVRLMGKVHGIPHEYNASNLLQKHPLYELAVSALDNLGEELVPKPRNVWHIVSMIILLSKDMWQIDALLQLLLYNGSPFTPRLITEAFYCMTTFLLYCNKEYELPTRYHYIVYYALYLYENRWTVTPTDDPGKLKQKHAGQQSIQSFVTYKSTVQHTHEQMKIINHNIEPNHLVKIVAFAGTGKTTTLLQMCKQRPHQRFLLVVYNKSVEEHCSKTFPKNVKVKTAHAMAFANVGRRFAAIKKLQGNLNSSRIAEFLQKKKDAGNRFKRAALVKNTIERFLNSPDQHITLQHVPTKDKNGADVDDDHRLQILLPDAEDVWKEMKKCSNTQKLSMTQDGQLKYWQLSKPKILGYDVIMIDEGQDMNATMFDIFFNQQCAKVIVGDPHQQIYSFRGAVNALQRINATHTYYLTQSFRFGPEISYIANCMLEYLKKVDKQTLVGGRKQDLVYVDSKSSAMSPSGKKLKQAYLARLNLTIYKLSISMCLNEACASKSMTFAGGLAKYGFDVVIDIFKLSQVQQGYGTAESLGIENKLVAKFSSVQSLKAFADNIDDHELSNKIRMFEFSGAKTPNHINLLKKRCNSDLATADIVFSTIHKAKGLEFDWVIMLDDLQGLNLPYMQGTLEGIGDEYNLMYVAVTRAKHWLTINSAVLYALTASKEKFEVIVSRNELETTARCLQCGANDIANSKLPLATKVITVPVSYQGGSFTGGYLCDKCITFEQFVPPMTTGHMYQQIRLLKDSSRICRRTLLTGRTEFKETLDMGDQYVGWHRYALQGQAARHQMNELDRLLFFEMDSDEDDDIILEAAPIIENLPAHVPDEQEEAPAPVADDNDVVIIQPEVIQID